MELHYTIFSSPLGELLVAGNSGYVAMVCHDVDGFISAHFHARQAVAGSVVSKAADEICAFLRGETVKPDVPLILNGTAFQRQVWEALAEIPYGYTSDYSTIAMRIGKPTAFRAVANACGKNPVPILIPCHRVLHKDGSLSGFAWGVDCKRRLLDLEAQGRQVPLAA